MLSKIVADNILYLAFHVNPLPNKQFTGNAALLALKKKMYFIVLLAAVVISLENCKSVTGKQCGPRSDATEPCV